ncbi:MAG: M20 family metallopeptidase [Bacillota bacterium]|nr:M20 family metallopeptidase [Bacillota bacterium]
MDLKQAFALIDRKDTELVAVLRQLLSIDTTNPPGLGYERMVEYLESRFRLLGFRNQRVLVPEEQWRSLPLPLEGPRVNLVSRRHFGKDREEVTIYGHMDTVPVEGEWAYDPFLGQVELGRIYGRGAADSKGAIAALIVAFEVIGQLRLDCRYNVTCCLTTDEEIGGYPGVLELSRRGFFTGHVLCLEGSQEPEEFVAAAGMVDVHITAKGRSCHTGVNYLGVNAVEEMIPVLEEMMRLKADVESREPFVPPGAAAGGSEPVAMRRSFTLAVLRGGEKSNVVPPECTLIINRRFTPDETREQAVQEIMDAVAAAKARSRALGIVTEVLPGFPALRVNLDNPHAARLRDARKAVMGYTDADFRRLASTKAYDLGFVQQTTGNADFYFLGVGRPDSHEHGADESCRLADMRNLTKELVYYLAF